MIRNPNWTRDELILSLSLYMRAGRRQLEASHPEVDNLSADLNNLPIHDELLRGTDFRNPQGVSMKLGNFLSIDPSAHRFFLVKRFYPTNFRKGSPGGMMAHLYFDLGRLWGPSPAKC
jgi:hypothetical protein